jgi:integrase
VKIKGVSHRLGSDKAEADRRLYLLMAGEQPKPIAGRDWLYASEVADQFQIALKEERSKATLDWYCRYLDPFKKRFLMSRADLLTVDSVREWINEKWKSQASRRAAARAVKAAFRRAMNDGKLTVCPVAGIKLPGETSRDYVVTQKEFEKVIEAITDKTFADLVTFVWITGARPQEVVILDDSHVDIKKSRIVIPVKLAKGKKKPRVIYMTKEAIKIIKPKMGKGIIFRTKSGLPFTKDIVRMRFRTLETPLGFRYCLYHFRHGFAHRSLAAGNDALTVATLLGHNSSQTLARVYAHLNQADDHLREALRKTTS